MLHRQQVDIQKAVHAACQAALFPFIELAIPDGARHTLFPADVGQGMRLYRKGGGQLASYPYEKEGKG